MAGDDTASGQGAATSTTGSGSAKATTTKKAGGGKVDAVHARGILLGAVGVGLWGLM